MQKTEKEQKHFFVRSKVWIINADGEVVFGSGRYRILESVQRLGSLNAAAKELRMSYKGLWSRITATERRLGWSLLIRDKSGSRLTAKAEDLMKRFSQANRKVASECDEAFDRFIRDALMGQEKKNNTSK